MWLTTVVCICITCYITYYMSLQTKNRTVQHYHTNFVIVQCVTIFSSLKWFCSHSDIPIIIRKVISSIGSCTYGIYLIHPFIKDRIWLNLLYKQLCNYGVGHMTGAFVYCIVTFIVSYGIILITSKVPGIRVVIGF